MKTASRLFFGSRTVYLVHDEGNRLVAGDVGSSAEAVLREVQGNDKLLHRVGEAEHRGDQAECRHNAAARYTRSRNHGNAQHEYKRSKHGKSRIHAACKHDTHRAEYEADGITVEVDGSAQRNDKVGNVVVDVVIICTVQCNRNS